VYADGCSVIAASRSAISHLWYRISHVEDPKALKGKIYMSRIKMYSYVFACFQTMYLVDDYITVTVYLVAYSKHRKAFVLGFIHLLSLCLSICFLR